MEKDRFYLELAMEEAERAGQEGTYPIGALVVGSDGSILTPPFRCFIALWS